MIDTTLLGETAAKCMEYMDEHVELDGGTLISTAIIVIAETAEGTKTFTRTFCSETMYYRQLGMMEAGLECIKEGFRPDGPDDEDDDEPA